MNKSREQMSPWTPALRSLLIGTGVGAISGVILLLAAAAVMASTGIPTGAVTPIALAVMSLSALIGGFVTARLARERGLLWGAACGLLMFLIVALAGLGVEHTVQGISLFLKLALTVACGALGGVLGVNIGRK